MLSSVAAKRKTMMSTASCPVPTPTSALETIQKLYMYRHNIVVSETLYIKFRVQPGDAEIPPICLHDVANRGHHTLHFEDHY